LALLTRLSARGPLTIWCGRFGVENRKALHPPPEARSLQVPGDKRRLRSGLEPVPPTPDQPCQARRWRQRSALLQSSPGSM